jgi:hypothetical protein
MFTVLGWVVPLLIGVLVAGAVFVVAPRFSQKAKRASDDSGTPDVSLSKALEDYIQQAFVA